MRTLTRWEPFGATTSLQDQVNRLFSDVFERQSEESSLTAWAPSVDIYETELELVVKADLPEVDPQDLDQRELSSCRARVRLFRSKLHVGEHREFGGHQGRLSKRGADPQHPEERGNQAQADQGQRRNSGCGCCRKVIQAEPGSAAVN